MQHKSDTAPSASLTCTTDLHSIPPFDLLDEESSRQLTSASRLVRASRGEILLQAQDIPHCIHVVLEGEARCLLLAPSGSEKLIRIVGAGDSFAVEAALLERPALTMVQAARKSRLLSVPVVQLRATMRAVPIFAEAMNRRLAAASYDMMRYVQLCIQLSSTQRVAHYLAQLAPQGAEHAEVRLAADKQTIAAQLNLTPETFSRVLSHFVREGLVRTQGRRGLVLDKISQLRAAAAD